MISKEEVLNLAELARLKLTDEEIVSLQKDISNILDYVAQVSDVSTRNVAQEETLTPLLHNVMREDTPGVVLGKTEALIEAFPTKEKAPRGGFFNVVRKIIQKDE